MRRDAPGLIPLPLRSSGIRPGGARVGRNPILQTKFYTTAYILQDYHGLSDEKVEPEIVDRTSSQRFLGIVIEGRIPDRTTVWNFKERLGEEGSDATFRLFPPATNFPQRLWEIDVIGTKGRIVDATFTDAPRQHNNRDENRRIKGGGGAPEEWSEAKKRQKDVAARGTKNNNETHYGDKNHVSTEEESKLINRH